ncbi:hypothetical protein MHYP_G00225590 [Metynnis hypsauchen]
MYIKRHGRASTHQTRNGQGGPPGSMGMCCSCLPLQRNAQHDADREEVRVQLEAIREEVDETSVGEERSHLPCL